MESSPKSEPPTICMGAKFDSFAQFESIFEPWKKENFHPFRVASSETMRHIDGQQDPVFRYKYIVYHCIHYGNPRMRGHGKRPNQSYLPSGCKAMLRLNFSYNDNSLRITTLHTEHVNHEVGAECYNGKIRKLTPLTELNLKPYKEVAGEFDTQSMSNGSLKHSPTNSSSTTSQSPPPHVPSSSSCSPNSVFRSQVLNNSPADFQPKPEQTPSTPNLATLLASAYVNNTPLAPPLVQNMQEAMAFRETPLLSLNQALGGGSNNALIKLLENVNLQRYIEEYRFKQSLQDVLNNRNEGLHILSGLYSTLLSANQATLQRLIPMLRNLRDVAREG